MCDSSVAAGFGPNMLRQVREAMIQGDPTGQAAAAALARVMCYRTQWTASPVGRRFWLELGDGQRDPVEVRLNGITLGRRCWAPWCVELTQAIYAGRNQLDLICANTLINRLEGVVQPSGLIGKPRLKVS